MFSVTAIAARVKISTLKTGAFRPVKLHREETKAERERHNTGLVDSVRVKLTNHPALKELDKIHKAAYTYHKSLTRPTIDEGMRLVPLCREFEHCQTLGGFRTQHDNLVAQFLADYEQERASAPQRLNGLFDASMWPTLDEVNGKFRFEISYRPCPTEGAWADWLSCSAVAAQQELREELESAILHIKERVSSDGKLYQSVFSNLKELLDHHGRSASQASGRAGRAPGADRQGRRGQGPVGPPENRVGSG
jgi:hypothetical protein